MSSNSIITKETILLSSLFLGSVYMTATSLKEVNKYISDSKKYNLIGFAINWSIFTTSGFLTLTAVDNMCEIMAKHDKIFPADSFWR